jgi:hypothetical protein
MADHVETGEHGELMQDQAQKTRIDRAMDRFAALSRRMNQYGRDVVDNPVRLLIGGICIVLLAVALPLLIGGGMRLDRAWTDWRHERSVGRDWIRSTGTLTSVREGDTLALRLTYFDRSGERHRAEVQVEASGAKWITSRMPIRYDPQHPSQVDLVNLAEINPLGSGLVAGASIGAGLASLILAFGIWRRRRVLADTSHPIAVLRVPLAFAGVVLAGGIAAWAVGTVKLRGWSGVATRLGNQLSTVFGDLLGVIVPLVTFAIGCLLTAWLARHRHHEGHDGMLSRVHGVIDRAAGFVPSPEDLQADVSVDEPRDTADDEPTEPVPTVRSELGDDLVREAAE